MTIVNSNEPKQTSGNIAVPTATATANVDHVNDAMFAQIAGMFVGTRSLNGDKNQTLIDKAINGRVIDLSSYVHAMRTAKLNLMESGKLVLSMYNGEKMFNHLMTPKERSVMSDVLSNPNLDESQKINKITSLVSNIAISTQMSYNFDKQMSQEQSISMHR